MYPQACEIKWLLSSLMRHLWFHTRNIYRFYMFHESDSNPQSVLILEQLWSNKFTYETSLISYQKYLQVLQVSWVGFEPTTCCHSRADNDQVLLFPNKFTLMKHPWYHTRNIYRFYRFHEWDWNPQPVVILEQIMIKFYSSQTGP